MPERVTSGATEEQGLSFDPDGRSFVTSVGASQSTLWVHDAKGDRQITSEGFAFLPSFSGDGKTLYYLVRSRASRRFVSGELWSANLETGRATRLLPDYLTEHYNVSPDGKRVVFLSVNEAGHSQLWLAPLDASSAPRRLASTEYADRALFDPHGGVLFAGGERGVYYLYHVNEDGTELRKLLPGPVSFLYAISPDGKAVAVWVGSDVYLDAYDGSSQTLICKGCGTAGEENRGVTPAFAELVVRSEVLVCACQRRASDLRYTVASRPACAGVACRRTCKSKCEGRREASGRKGLPRTASLWRRGSLDLCVSARDHASQHLSHSRSLKEFPVQINRRQFLMAASLAPAAAVAQKAQPLIAAASRKSPG